ncbi:MAG: tetratricopeptide repeat protein [Streptosporangiales bacterium]|nr:tetratricopeptide repeat protein [Streptosporangiales bacterium]
MRSREIGLATELSGEGQVPSPLPTERARRRSVRRQCPGGVDGALLDLDRGTRDVVVRAAGGEPADAEDDQGGGHPTQSPAVAELRRQAAGLEERARHGACAHAFRTTALATTSALYSEIRPGRSGDAAGAAAADRAPTTTAERPANPTAPIAARQRRRRCICEPNLHPYGLDQVDGRDRRHRSAIGWARREVAVAEPTQCRILGPLEVLVGGRPVALGGRRPRALLATLLLDAGRVVPTERLTAAVWGDELPGSVRAQVSIHVSALRRALERAGCAHPMIETVPGGYLVRTDALRLDADEARRCLDEARDAVDKGFVDKAAELLRYALSSWRGPVLAELTGSDITGSSLTTGAARLEELRLTIAEEWADVELGRGGHRAVSGELRALVAEHPLRERLRARLMRALAESGRQSEALDAYREGRRVLVDELGVEPGAELRRVEQAVLTGEIGPATRPDESTPGGPASGDTVPARDDAVPSSLPRDVASFTGRAAEVERLGELIRDGGALAIAGAGGVGKSALAIHLAHLVADRFPDGRLYVDLHGSTPDGVPLEPAAVLVSFLGALGVPTSAIPSGDDELDAMFRSLTHRRRLLVVLDNAADARQVRRLMPGGPGCAVVVTSRRVLGALDSATSLTLDVFDDDDAHELLARIAGRERVETEPGATADVVRMCERLPLALALAAARLASRPSWSVRDLADRLAGEHGRLSELTVDDQGVRASFMVSYADLDDPHTGRMFRLLGLLDGLDVGVPVAAALADVSEDRAEEVLDRLVDAQLAQTRAPGRYHMHDLLRLFAHERAVAEETEEARVRARRRAVHCYVGTALTASSIVAPSYAWRTDLAPTTLTHPGVALTSVADVNAWVEVERDNLIAAARQAASGDEPGVAMSLAAALDAPLEYRGRWREQLTVGEIALQAATRTGDPRHLGLAHNDLGWAYNTLGYFTEALDHLEQGLARWQSVGHREGEALTLHGIGVVCRSLGRLDRALDCLGRASRLGDPGRAATCLTSTGLVYHRLGRLTEAVAAHEASVALAREKGTMRTEVIALGNLAEAHRLAGTADRAVATFREALAAGRATGYAGTYWEAEHLWGLGRALHDLGMDGCDSWQRSAAILLALGLVGPEEAAEIERNPDPETPAAIIGQL